MVSELQKFIESDSVIFGARESLRYANKISKAFVPVDCRDRIVEMLIRKKIDVEQIGMTKKEIAEKLGLEFYCEVFGIKN